MAFVLDHPLAGHRLALLRDRNTAPRQFRALIGDLAAMLCYEAARTLPLRPVTVETPVAEAQCRQLAGPAPVVVPILRAGLGMADRVLELLPDADMGHIGLYRDETTLEPVEYYCKLPADIADRPVFLVDPMLATGGSANDALAVLKKHGCTDIRFMCIIAAPEGIQAVAEKNPDVKIYVSTLDRCLNDKCYILPGLGDAGDRLYGTKQL